MIMSATALTILVTIALLVTITAPILLLVMFVRDKRNGRIW